MQRSKSPVEPRANVRVGMPGLRASANVLRVSAHARRLTQVVFTGLISAVCSAVPVTALRLLFRAANYHGQMRHIFLANEKERGRTRPILPRVHADVA